MKVKCLLLFLWPIVALAQVSFRTDSRILNNQHVHSQVPIAIIDINNDLLDDIVVLDDGNHLKVFYQTQNTTDFFVKDYGLVSIFDQLALTAGDIDNDGWKEIFVGGYYDGVKIYKAFEESTDFLQFRKTSSNFYTQNISLVDIDEDGLLDLFVNDDDDSPKVFQNIAGSEFISFEPFDFPDAGEAGSGNYGSVFTDFDDDGDLDLYISKCRLGVSNAADTRRINQLWVNDGSGNYSELAGEFGLDVGEQSWVSEFADLDNDGDRDLVMINHTGGNYIYENVEGEYIKRIQGEDWNEVYEGLQLIVRDFDNDGLKDIMTAGFSSKLFWNRGGFDFQEDKTFLLDKRALSMAVGDLNNDGFWDILTSYAVGIAKQNDYLSDEVWLNTLNSNHFVKITLKGTTSNKDAVGTSAKLYGEWGIQDYEVKLGESYGITNSLSVIFGLGASTAFDSLVVRWPDGESSSYENIDIDKHYILQENGCLSPQVVLSSPVSNILCKDEITVIPGPEASAYEWSDGSSNSTLFTDQTGFYQLNFTDTTGCENATSSLYLRRISELEVPVIRLLDPYDSFCPGDGITLATQYDMVLWNGELESSVLYALAGDTIGAALELCDTLKSEPFIVTTLMVNVPLVENDTIEAGEVAEFRADGQNIRWYESLNSSDIISEGNAFSIQELAVDSTLFATSVTYSSSYDTVSFEHSSTSLDFPPDNINGGLIFSVNDYVTMLESIVCYADTAAIRNIQIKDYWGNILHEKEVLISPEDSIVQLDFLLAPSSYYLITTDANTNIANLGSKSPRLKRSLLENSIFHLDSETGNVSILNSTGTPLNYYSFYSWKLEDYDLVCESDRVAVQVVVNQASSIAEIQKTLVSVRPNPFSDKLIISGIVDPTSKLLVLDVTGKVVFQSRGAEEINLANLTSGIYFLKVENQVTKIVKR